MTVFAGVMFGVPFVVNFAVLPHAVRRRRRDPAAPFRHHSVGDAASAVSPCG